MPKPPPPPGYSNALVYDAVQLPSGMYMASKKEPVQVPGPDPDDKRIFKEEEDPLKNIADSPGRLVNWMTQTVDNLTEIPDQMLNIVKTGIYLAAGLAVFAVLNAGNVATVTKAFR